MQGLGAIAGAVGMAACSSLARSKRMTTPGEVLDFWFGEPARDAEGWLQKVRRWFRGGSELDHEIIARFGPAVHAALAGELDGWAASPRERLALILLLDQFTRNVFRGDSKTYAGDGKAQKLALDALACGFDKGMSHLERMFLAMPLVHAENLQLQERALALAKGRQVDAPAALCRVMAMSVEQSEKYRDIIARFGRFPHRNAILGRTSTAEEVDFLRDWDKKAAPKGMRPTATSTGQE